MENIKFSKITKESFGGTNSIIYSNQNKDKIYTPEIIKKYKKLFKTIFRLNENKTKIKFIMYDNVWIWYEEEDINISLEKIYIKTKLGSFSSGGCGIGASLLAGLTASGIYSYMDNYLKNLGTFFLIVYIILILCFGVKILYTEDNKVEMYNMFLEVLNNLEYERRE